MAAKLVAEEGLLKGLVLLLEEGDRWVIGRDPDACQLLIEDPAASRKHMVCRTTPEGIQAENLSTTNPVQVNDEALTEPKLLHTGDSLKIGSGVFRFYAQAAAQLFQENEELHEELSPELSLNTETAARNNNALADKEGSEDQEKEKDKKQEAQEEREEAAGNEAFVEDERSDEKKAPVEDQTPVEDKALVEQELKSAEDENVQNENVQDNDVKSRETDNQAADLAENEAKEKEEASGFDEAFDKELDEALETASEAEKTPEASVPQASVPPAVEKTPETEKTPEIEKQPEAEKTPLDEGSSEEVLNEESLNEEASEYSEEAQGEEKNAPEIEKTTEAEKAPLDEESFDEATDEDASEYSEEAHEEVSLVAPEEDVASNLATPDEAKQGDLHEKTPEKTPVEPGEAVQSLEEKEQTKEEELSPSLETGPLEIIQNETKNPAEETSTEPNQLSSDESTKPPAQQPPEQKSNKVPYLTSPHQELIEDEDIDTPHDSVFNEEPSENDSFLEINFGLIDAGRWLLKVVNGPNHGAEFSMTQDSSYLIGTDPNSCDIVFHDTSVSRQHARIFIDKEDTLAIEDLRSRNGTLVDGESLKGKQPLPLNTLVSMGTTSFIVFDREGEMQTIISPLLPSIVKVLQQEEAPSQEVKAQAATPAETQEPLSTLSTDKNPLSQETGPQAPAHPTTTIGAFILIGIITGLFVIVGIGMSTLFKSEPVAVQERVDPTKLLDEALAPFSSSVKYTFNPGTGRLLLVGHVLTPIDKNQLLYTLQGLKFIKNLDDSGIIIDEYVWREINQVLNKNPNWKGITIQSPSAGRFVLSGYLKTRAQAEHLNEYISNNFPYLDLLEKRVIVDENVVTSVNGLLDNMGFKGIAVKLENGELTLSGKIPIGKSADIDALIAEVKNLPGIRNVRNLLTEVAPEQSFVNISDKYEVTGSSHQGGANLNVVINGRILMKGDVLDGMTITSVQAHTILLEKDGVKYRIDYSR